jgi:hypothetical protein
MPKSSKIEYFDLRGGFVTADLVESTFVGKRNYRYSIPLADNLPIFDFPTRFIHLKLQDERIFAHCCECSNRK